MRRRLAPVLPLLLLLTACSGSAVRDGAHQPPPDSAAAREAEREAQREEEIARLADDYMARAAAHEPEVSRILQEVAARVGGKLVGFEHRLKTRESLIRKIRSRLARGPSLEVSQVVIDDSLRYTLQVEDDPPGHHEEAIRTALAALEQAGHTVKRVKNYWPRGDNYSGVNSVLVAPDGLPWELQFHTAESFRVKEETHALYEEMRKDSTPPERKRELFRQLSKPWEAVPIPAEMLTPGGVHRSEEIILNPPP